MTVEDEADQIDAYIADGTEPWPDATDLTPLDIDSRTNASRELRRLARLDAEAAEVEAVYADRKAALDRYRTDRMSGITSRRLWVETGLEQFMRAEAERSGIKSLTLPDGTLKLTKARASVDGLPLEVPEDWQPFLLKRNPQLDRAEIHKRLKPGAVIADEHADGTVWREALDPDGNPVQGVWFVVPARASFTVKLSEADSGD